VTVYLGAYQLGSRVQLPAFNADLGVAPANPTAAPRAVVYPASGRPANSYLLPPLDLDNATGLFGFTAHLGNYSVGDYAVLVCYSSGGTPRAELHRFTVLTGGHADGTVIAIYPYHRPQAEFLVQQLDSGKLFRGRSPAV
jgi:hypothetical protein